MRGSFRYDDADECKTITSAGKPKSDEVHPRTLVSLTLCRLYIKM